MNALKEKWGGMTTLRKIQWILFGLWLLSMVIAAILGWSAYARHGLGVYALLMFPLGIVQTCLDSSLSPGQKWLRNGIGAVFTALVALVVLDEMDVLSFTPAFSMGLHVACFVYAVMMIFVMLRLDEKGKSQNHTEE